MTDAIADYITRSEYTSRHEELIARVTKTEALVEAYRDNMALRFDKLSDKIDNTSGNLATQINSLEKEMYKGRLSGLRWAIGTITSFIVGGASLVGILQVFHLLK